MLQKTRNEQTLKILDRLRRQGAPKRSAVPGEPIMGLSEEGEEPGLEQEEELPGEMPDESGVIQDASLPMSQAMTEAKKKLKRRY
jgi:hypothetical protein